MSQTSAYKSFSLSRRLQRDGFAGLISDLFNPLFLTPLVIGLMSWIIGLPSATLGWIVAISFFFYTLIPVLATFYLLKKNYINSVDLPERKSRNQLFLFSIVCAAAAFLCLNFIPSFTHPLPGTLAFVFLLNPFVGFLINFKWKMSIHTAALSSAGAIFFTFSYLDSPGTVVSVEIFSAVILLLLMPLVTWARYRLNIHSLGELIGGALAGFLLTIIELSLLLNFW